jgi:uncharacterized membrane protein YesL
MSRLFSPDSKFMGFLSKVESLFLLNLVTFLCCLPIVTVGAAITAMDFVLLKIVRNEEGYLIRDFFRSFKENLKPGIMIGLLETSLLVLLAVNARLTRGAGAPLLFEAGLQVLGIFVVCHMAYTFAGLSRYVNPIGRTLMNGLVLMLYHLPQTAAILFLLVVWGGLFNVGFPYLLPLYLFFGFTLPGFFIMSLLSPIFKRSEQS